MHTYTVTNQHEEVSGIIMPALLNLTQKNVVEDLTPIIERHGLSELSADGWYPLEDFFALYQDIQSSSVFSLVAIGMEVGTLIAPPPGTPLKEALSALNGHYQAHHRNHPPEVGWLYREVDATRDVVTCTSAYPRDLEYGIVFATVRACCPPGYSFVITPVELDDEVWEYHVEIVPRR